MAFSVRYDARYRVGMLQDLAAITPPLLVCAAFIIGVAWLVRRELAPKRRAERDRDDVGMGGADMEERGQGALGEAHEMREQASGHEAAHAHERREHR